MITFCIEESTDSVVRDAIILGVVVGIFLRLACFIWKYYHILPKEQKVHVVAEPDEAPQPRLTPADM